MLDKAHMVMIDQPQNNNAALAFYERVADAELFLMLETEIAGDVAKPLIFDIGDTSIALAFDREDRLAAFVDQPTPYIAMSGRQVVHMLASHDVGMGLNLGVAPSSIQIPVEAIIWLDGILQHEADELQATANNISAPKGLSDDLITALDAKLASMGGVLETAYLVMVKFDDNTSNHMLALIDVPPSARQGMIQALSETVRFCADDAMQLDITFIEGGSAMFDSIVKHGLKITIAKPEVKQTAARTAPGMDADNPPVLR